MSIHQENSAEISHILGIDFGQAKVGLALADTETRMAFSLQTLENNKDLFQKLAEIIEEKGVKTVVIGVATYVNRKETEYPGETLGAKLKELLPYVEVFYQNEMFTTKMAQQNLIEQGVKGIKRYDDQEAARIILQEWLDRK